jgi:hypothetical protein
MADGEWRRSARLEGARDERMAKGERRKTKVSKKLGF